LMERPDDARCGPGIDGHLTPRSRPSPTSRARIHDADQYHRHAHQRSRVGRRRQVAADLQCERMSLLLITTGRGSEVTATSHVKREVCNSSSRLSIRVHVRTVEPFLRRVARERADDVDSPRCIAGATTLPSEPTAHVAANAAPVRRRARTRGRKGHLSGATRTSFPRIPPDSLSATSRKPTDRSIDPSSRRSNARHFGAAVLDIRICAGSVHEPSPLRNPLASDPACSVARFSRTRCRRDLIATNEVTSTLSG